MIKIKKAVKREFGWMYFINKHGDIEIQHLDESRIVKEAQEYYDKRFKKKGLK